jgi:hypothetical protein
LLGGDISFNATKIYYPKVMLKKKFKSKVWRTLIEVNAGFVEGRKRATEERRGEIFAAVLIEDIRARGERRCPKIQLSIHVFPRFWFCVLWEEVRRGRLEPDTYQHI